MKSRHYYWLYICLLTTVLSIAARNVLALGSCYEEKNYPNIIEIRKGTNGLEFIAGGINRDREKDLAPVITLQEGDTWEDRVWTVTGTTPCKEYGCIKESQGCQAEIPKIQLSIKEALQLRSFSHIPGEIDQNISACVKDGDNIYFGISFYAGEGMSGVGGIGRYEPSTERMEIRRLPILLDSSVTHMAFDGRLLWIATAGHYECSGTPPAVGLIRYDWKKNVVQKFEDIDNGFCGFLVHDIYITDKVAWVATDMGISQTDRGSGVEFDEYGWIKGWRHYVPQTKSKEPMRKVWCDDLYSELLDTLPRHDNPVGTSSYLQLFENMIKFKPYSLLRYIQSKEEILKSLQRPESGPR